MPALDGLPENVTEVGSINISVFMGPEGLGHAYGFEGLTPEAAIGYLTVTLDRMRAQQSAEWGGGADDDLFPMDLECPECGHSIFDEAGDDEDEHEA